MRAQSRVIPEAVIAAIVFGGRRHLRRVPAATCLFEYGRLWD